MKEELVSNDDVLEEKPVKEAEPAPAVAADAEFQQHLRSRCEVVSRPRSDDAIPST